jgi:cytochrome c-type protein NapB
MKLIQKLGMALMLCIGVVTVSVAADPLYDKARGTTPLLETTTPPVLGNAVNDDVRRTRNYAQQPPVIPHRIDGYQVDKNFNKCMDCHSRNKAEASQAVPVSITHYHDRDGNTLEQISTRRYYCVQCHVGQENVAPFVENTFKDVDSLLLKALQNPGNAAKKN